MKNKIITDVSEIKDFIKKEHQRIVKNFGHKLPKEKRTLLRTIKLMEEVGELCEQVMHSVDEQRKDKINDSSIAEELADILVVLLMLAQNLDIDLFKATKDKIKKLKKRNWSR